MNNRTIYNHELQLSNYFEIIEQSVELMRDFDSICPNECCKCEDMECMVLIPGEEIFWNYTKMGILSFNISPNGYLYLTEDDHHCPFFSSFLCKQYNRRPIDCRIFPLYPYFNLAENSVTISKATSYCPINDSLSDDFIKTVHQVCQLLNNSLPVEWKQFYNQTIESNLRKTHQYFRFI